MNGPPPMPPDFGFKYLFWVTWRWIYFNPLTLLFILQAELVELALDYPTLKWLAQAASGVGIVIAQIRNRDKDYTIPILPKQPEKPEHE
jgi:hypothetical protein